MAALIFKKSMTTFDHTIHLTEELSIEVVHQEEEPRAWHRRH